MSNSQTAQVFTGKGVDAFRLLSLKHQLKLEKIGMKSSGGALRPRLAKEFGLKKTDSHDTYIAAIEARVKVIKDEMDAAIPT